MSTNLPIINHIGKQQAAAAMKVKRFLSEQKLLWKEKVVHSHNNGLLYKNDYNIIYRY